MRRRLEHLEARESERSPGARGTPPALRRYFEALAGQRREAAGLPVAERPYAREDYDDDMTAIAAYRRDPGWQSEEARAALDEWERLTRSNLEKGVER